MRNVQLHCVVMYAMCIVIQVHNHFPLMKCLPPFIQLGCLLWLLGSRLFERYELVSHHCI